MASCAPVRVRAACLLVLLTRSRKFWAPGPAESRISTDPPELPPSYAYEREGAKAACADVVGCWLRNGLELDHLRSGKCDAQHVGPEVHEHCRIAVLGADHGTEAIPIMADSIAHGVGRHYSDGWRLVEGTSWEGRRGAGAARSHASSVRPLARAGAPLPDPLSSVGLRAMIFRCPAPGLGRVA